MGCFQEEARESFPRKEGFKSNRAITDKGACFGCIAFFAGMVAIIAWAILHGNPKRLTHGTDWAGQICGEDVAVKNAPYMMFCGSSARTGQYPKYILEGSTVCVNKCPIDSSAEIDCLMPAFHNFTSYKGGSIGGAIPNVETLEMTLTQSVTKQPTYPTEEWGGRFCLPSSKNPALRNMIIDGPWGQYYRPMLSVGGLMDAWPLLLISAGLATLMGWGYLLCLQKFAGPLIFFSMVLSTMSTLAFGVMFFLAIAFDMNDNTSDYAELNPIMSVYVGEEARIYSIIIGVVLILLGAIFAVMTSTSLKHIDECVGLLDAVCDVVSRRGPAMQIFALCQGASFLVLVGFFALVGLPYVASLGAINQAEINVNGIPIIGLQKVYEMRWFEHAAFWYYVVGMIFLLEFYLQFGHYVLAYTVSCWYFTKGTERRVDNNKLMEKALGKGVGKKVEVRVAGADENFGGRKGTIVSGANGQKMLVVPVGKKGPGIGRNDLVESEFIKPSGPSLIAIGMGSVSAFIYHIGSFAIGAPVIFIFRPFRMISQVVISLLTRSAEEGMSGSYDEDPHNANIKSCLTLMSACLEQSFGKYDKNAFTELVLSGGGEDGVDGFFAASEQAFSGLVRSGGSVAHLHGSMLLYEIFGVMSITSICGWLSLVLGGKLGMFNDQTSANYIEDKNASAILSMIVAFAVSFAWMAMWNQTSDVLLYCVAWNRRMLHEGEEHNLTEHDMIGEVTEFCPQTLRNILPAHELEAAHEHGLHAHGLGQQGAILAAMEHGAMNQGGSGPDYSKTMANAHTMATRMVQG